MRAKRPRPAATLAIAGAQMLIRFPARDQLTRSHEVDADL